jgi:hypothetical protein
MLQRHPLARGEVNRAESRARWTRLAARLREAPEAVAVGAGAGAQDDEDGNDDPFAGEEA